MDAPAMEIRNIGLSYGANCVLNDISFSIAPGETAALVGENGAGKSSLAKIIAGVQRQDSGQLLIGGRELQLSSPRNALESGIAFIPQELIHAPHLSVAENILLGRLPTTSGFTRSSRVVKEAQAIADEMGFDLPLAEPMSTLTPMQQQLVEVLKAFARKPSVLVLDEPTAALEAADSELLLDMMSTIAARGVGLLYISHRLDEIFRSCDTIHVLRGGYLVHSAPTASTTPSMVVTAMLDQPLDDTLVAKSTVKDRPEILVVDSLSRSSHPQLDEVSFAVGAGEIVGMYGIRGSGAETIAEGLVGMHRGLQGEISYQGKQISIPRNMTDARALGISFIPADRKSQGLLLGHPIVRSIGLPVLRMLTAAGFIVGRKERDWSDRVLGNMSVKYLSAQQDIAQLSGGNQQKVLVGSRTLDQVEGLVIAMEPTRGVDIGSRHKIHLHLRALAETGVGILVVSTDLDEIVNLSDRLLVMRAGSIVHEFDRPDPSVSADVISYAGGLTDHAKQ